MLGLVEADHRGLRPVTAVEQNLARPRVELDQRQLRGGRRVAVAVREDRLDVAEARDHVVVDRGGVEHRPVRERQRVHHRERVGEELGRERIELGLDRT
jgi:hypothetical protein